MKLILLLLLAMAAVVALGALDASDADAGKGGKRPPDYNMVFCLAGDFCHGTPNADLMVGAAGNELLQGEEGNDIYMGSAGQFDHFTDESASSDLYGGFVNDQFVDERITDGGGLDRVDLSTNASLYASTDFEFVKDEDDLYMLEINRGGNDSILVLNHFAEGRIESFKFTDTTLNGAALPLSQ
jgi:hypothetical protein